MYKNKYNKYKNKYIKLKNIIFLNKLSLEDKIKLCYKLYNDNIILKLYIYIYNNNIYDINIEYNKIIKSNILNIIIHDLKKVNSEYINIAYIIPLENIKKLNK
jgi:hypothetical protein